MTLLAPAAGRIIRRDGEFGQLIEAGHKLFWISCCDQLRVSAEVDEEDIPLVKPGQKVLIRADAFPGRALAQKLNLVMGENISASSPVGIVRIVDGRIEGDAPGV